MALGKYLAILAITAWMGAVGLHPAAADPSKPIAVRIAAAAPAVEDDEYEGLPAGEGRDEVFGICGACHSLKLVTQQGLPRSRWEETLVYMVEEQEMPQLDEETLSRVLDYLATFYGPDRRARSMAR